MTRHSRFGRFLFGLLLVSAILAGAGAILPSYIHTWGATAAETERAMPGDEILSTPSLTWNHGITIRAGPDEVWPWIAQIGDVRGGFYSYTFIENLFPGEPYRNANEIIAGYQDPQPGQGMIADLLTVREVEPGQYLLAHLAGVPEFGWSWIWHVYPADGGDTRLVIRMGIQPAAGMNAAAMTYVMDVGGFVMERRMMQGIKDRAEGRRDMAGSEVIEIVLWMSTLIIGLVAARLFVTRKNWQAPLLVGLLALLSLLVFTFLQPAVWIRALVDVLLLGGLILYATARRGPKQTGLAIPL